MRTSTPAPISWVAMKWRRSWSRTCGAPTSLRTRMKNDVTLSGRNGVVASTEGENTKAFGATTTPASRTHRVERARCCVITATPTGSSATLRPRSVLVVFSASPLGTTTTERVTWSVPVSRSTSDHRSAHSSPRRMPVSAASISTGASRGSRRSTASITS